MITSMHIENFKCFKDFDINLGPFNVLIGPNDTGKTVFLQAVQLLGLSHGDPPNAANILERAKSGPAGIREFSLDLDLNAVLRITQVSEWKQMIWRINPDNKPVFRASEVFPDGQSSVVISSTRPSHLVAKFGVCVPKEFKELSVPSILADSYFKRVACYRLRPELLRQTSKLSDEFDQDGKGFPALLDTISRTDREVFLQLEKEFYRRFPYYSRIELPVEKQAGSLGIRFRTVNNELLWPQSVSDGVMLALAFLAVSYQLDPPKILLIEEPENGVHHGSLKDIVETLKQLSTDKGVQVILTTHSPYLLDGVDPGVVQVFQKDDEGAVHAKRLSDFEGADEISEMFSTGEKWSLLAEKYGI